jgi:rRNA maturation protein Rpf1
MILGRAILKVQATSVEKIMKTVAKIFRRGKQEVVPRLTRKKWRLRRRFNMMMH